MASIFLRKKCWWVKFRDPRSGGYARESLQTGDPARAELLRERLEHEMALLDPRFQEAQLPEKILSEFGIGARAALAGTAQADTKSPPTPASEAPAQALGDQQSPALSGRAAAAPRTEADEAFLSYLRHIREENNPRHAENKVSMLRRLVGGARVEAILGKLDPARKPSAAACLKTPGFFKGTYLDEITSTLAREFVDKLPVGRKTKRHYREFLHHFFEVCLKSGLYEPSNWHRPNPISALPGYATRNRRIVFLSPNQAKEQLEALASEPDIQLAAAVMIHAGLRRSEALWLTRENISADFRHMRVVNKVDKEFDIESSLKTGERTVTILNPLREILSGWLAQKPGSGWLIQKREGGRWSPDGFSRKLRRLNQERGLKWTSLHFRHTYATERAAEGWSLFRISKEMGNSAAAVEEYYAGYILPCEPVTAA